MIVVVSETLSDESGKYICVRSVTDVADLVGNIEHLVLWGSNDSFEVLKEELTKLKGKFSYLWLIGEGVSSFTMGLVSSLGGRVIPSPASLVALGALLESESGKVVYELGALASPLGVLKDFTSRFLETDENTPLPKPYLKVLEKSVNEISTEVAQKDLQIQQMSADFVDTLANQAVTLNLMQEEQVKALNALKDLEILASQQAVAPVHNPVPMFFPVVNYTKEKDLLRFKRLGSVPYLRSFLFGLKFYIETIEKKRCKLIFIESVGGVVKKQFASYPWITSNSFRDMSLYVNDVVFTNYPVQSVLNELLDDNSKDTFIVADFSNHNVSHILNSRRVRPIFYAMGSREFYKDDFVPALTSHATLSSIQSKHHKDLVTIPYIRNYPFEVFERQSSYLNHCSQRYKTLYYAR